MFRVTSLFTGQYVLFVEFSKFVINNTITELDREATIYFEIQFYLII